jgi:uncharacterized protein DUF1579
MCSRAAIALLLKPSPEHVDRLPFRLHQPHALENRACVIPHRLPSDLAEQGPRQLRKQQLGAARGAFLPTERRLTMKRALTLLVIVPVLLFTLASILAAQSESQTSKPGPEHQRLHYFVGNWQITWETKPGPMGPGGTVTVTDHNEMLGELFVVFHRKGRGPKGSGKEIGFLGYDPEQKVYTYEVFSDDGSVGRATATLSGDTWVLLAPALDVCQQGGDKVKERYTLKEVSPTSYTFIGELSTDAGPWTEIEEGKATKKVR